MNTHAIKPIALLVAALAALAPAASAQTSPFEVQASLRAASPEAAELSVAFTMPEGHYLYADQMAVTPPEGVPLTPTAVPEPHIKHDAFQEKDVGVYDKPVTFRYTLRRPLPAPLEVTVAYQGCNASLCFLPARKTFRLALDGAAAATAVAAAPAAAPAAATAGGPDRFQGFAVAGRAAGYLPVDRFLAFLDDTAAGRAAGTDAVRRAFDTRGLWLTILLILVGGLALNLTPCVLPMIPINIAIIGAGSAAGSRGRGFALGGAYGLGIALVYGALGLIVVLTGAKFGTLNASPWFNLGVAAVFVLLALAMFGVFNVDLSRFQGGGPGEARRGRFVTALFFGGLAALLAGACVAPVVISVLLLAADLYARGRVAGLLLPFLLGVGMALPWPFAGAGLSFLPKPGRWMERVKIGFGVLILGFAAWYGKLGVDLLRQRSAPPAALEAAARAQAEEGWTADLDAALDRARREGKPVFIDFWASWCKNCLHMDASTFKDPKVRARLEDYVKVKYHAEDISAPAVKATLDRFGAVGLPTYVVLTPPAR